MISPHQWRVKTLEEFFARIGKLTKCAITFGQSTDMCTPGLGMTHGCPTGT